MENVGFQVGGVFVDMDKPLPNIFSFCTFMAARVAKQRGGANHQYLAECGDFMAEVVGHRLRTSDPLPPDFDWTPAAAIECPEAKNARASCRERGCQYG